MKKIRILSIDGGGIRGILPGTIVTYLEEQIRHKTGNATAHIGEYFDFLSGTSTGGILSLIYLCPGEDKKYKFSAKDALDLYLKLGGEIFDIDLRQKIESMGGICDEKYEANNLEEALEEYFGKKTLNDVLKPCLISSYDIRNRKAHFFTSLDAESDIYNYQLKDVARATSAAPTFFEPVRIKSLYGTPHALVDGGVFANNPTLCAYAEARNIQFSKVLDNPEKPNKPSAKDMLIVSVGTGSVKQPYPYEDYKDAGVLKWINPLIDIMMTGNSETVDYQLKKIYDTLAVEDCEDYYRIQPQLIHADSAMDNAKPGNLKVLHEDGLAAVEKHKEQLDEIVQKLISNH
ncbi:patatin-like phospholipase family protein [Autumnicola musiva]|uniref:Patatin-like phospholipase family protein n=1 Tax=Autumnicola musiva TaxID=3075589 RepID=A0ABU3D568_9FLAO|nr:patatin-like phospholipase family protein [Zunongwangia sp. F117]MDT0676676.1 patatin-like phospholipase family protein [Zunongwangia sp. F117]